MPDGVAFVWKLCGIRAEESLANMRINKRFDIFSA